MVSKLQGFGGVLTSVLFWGSFTLFMKVPKVMKANLDPFLFQLYMSFSVLIISLFVPMFDDFNYEWSWYGTLSAAFWVPGSFFSVFAVKNLGMSLAQGLWSSIIMLTSFSWGAFYFGESPSNWSFTLLGMLFLLCGVAGLATSSKMAENLRKKKMDGALIDSPIVNLQNKDLESQTLIEKNDEFKPNKLVGFICTFGCGLCAGSTNAPLKMAPDSIQGLTFQFPFGVSAMVITIIICAAEFIRRKSIPPLHFKDTFWAGSACGVFWTIAQLGSIIASLSSLGLTVGFPLTQCCLLIGGLWGVFFFKEIIGTKAKTTFFVSAIILITGSSFLAIFGA